MVIRRSSAAEIQALLANLDGTGEVRREAAVARLAIIGGRAVPRLVSALQSTLSPRGRVAALQALESIGDFRALEPALKAFDDERPEVAAAAVAVARACLRIDEGTVALDRLTAMVTDGSLGDPPRLMALDALAEVPSKVLEPILEKLAEDPSAAVRARVAGGPPPLPVGSALDNAAAELVEGGAGHLPADPAALRQLVADQGAQAPLPTLHHLVEVTRAREEEAASPAARQAWAAARASVHQALARRGSNVALYDLRETIERATGPLAVEFLAALALVGDETCLEPVVMVYARSAGSSKGARADWWQAHLLEAFRQIVKRERLTGRHSVMRRIRTRWPGAVAELEEPKRKRGTTEVPAVPR